MSTTYRDVLAGIAAIEFTANGNGSLVAQLAYWEGIARLMRDSARRALAEVTDKPWPPACVQEADRD